MLPTWRVLPDWRRESWGAGSHMLLAAFPHDFPRSLAFPMTLCFPQSPAYCLQSYSPSICLCVLNHLHPKEPSLRPKTFLFTTKLHLEKPPATSRSSTTRVKDELKCVSRVMEDLHHTRTFCLFFLVCCHCSFCVSTRLSSRFKTKTGLGKTWEKNPRC